MPNDDKTFAWVKGQVNRLERSNDMQAYKLIMRDNWAMHTMQPAGAMPLPEYITKRAGVQVDMPSPLLMQTSQAFISETDGFPWFVRVNAQPGEGNATAPQKDTADKIERHLTLAKLHMDEGGNLTRMTRWHQGSSCYGVLVAKCLPPPKGEARKKPFVHMSIESPAPDTCFFGVKNGGAFRPQRFAIKDKVEAEWVQDEFGDYDGCGVGPILKQGKWGLYPLADSKHIEEADSTTGWSQGDPSGKKRDSVMVTRYYLDTGKRIYIAVENAVNGPANDTDGVVLWQDENPLGRVMAIVVPGQATPLRQAGKQMLAMFEALLVNEKSVNFLYAYTITTGLSNDPDVLINMSPAQIAAHKDAGLIRPASSLEIEGAGPYLVNVPGDATPWVKAAPEQVKIMMELKRTDSQSLAAEWRALLDKDVLRDVTATTYGIATGSQARYKTTPLGMMDQAWAWLLKDYFDTRKKYNGVAPMGLYAGYDIRRERGGQIGRGEYADLSPSDLELDVDVGFATRQETEEQLALKVQQALFEVDAGLSTMLQAISVRYPDVTSQLNELADDLGRQIYQPLLVTEVGTLIEADMYTEMGYLVQQGKYARMITELANPMAGQPGAQPAAAQQPNTFGAGIPEAAGGGATAMAGTP